MRQFFAKITDQVVCATGAAYVQSAIQCDPTATPTFALTATPTSTPTPNTPSANLD
ncbi:MAG: hypothetical protein HY270_21495 [Deltaproteobacteria bacterium]|nr:hypothetical protein [Deltaproteobacteria bacterium]